MRRFLILMRDDFDIAELKALLDEKKQACLFVIGHNVAITGEAKYGTFCSILWHCQKFGEVKCILSPA